MVQGSRIEEEIMQALKGSIESQLRVWSETQPRCMFRHGSNGDADVSAFGGTAPLSLNGAWQLKHLPKNRLTLAPEPLGSALLRPIGPGLQMPLGL